ncbi:hypothetical protein R1sor_015861 [Riccia sorocarpa]|uniref:DUF1492 domain-containing protein n=1 Tax=Riccia sorocarpa TaxID=122646 RepID=A0ABD3HDF0_9MARC
MAFFERRYQWAYGFRKDTGSSRMEPSRKAKSREDAENEMRRVVEECKRMTVETPIDATIEAQEIMLTICSEAEKELVEGLKVSTAEEQRLRMRNVYGKICEMRYYLYQTADELEWLVERTSKGTVSALCRKLNEEIPCRTVPLYCSAS